MKGVSVFDHYDAVRNAVTNTALEHPQIYGDWKVGMLPLCAFIGHSNENNVHDSDSKIKDLPNIKFMDTFDRDLITVDATSNKKINSLNE